MQNYFMSLNIVVANGLSKPVAINRLYHADTLAIVAIIVKERLWQIAYPYEVMGQAKLEDVRGLRRYAIRGGGYTLHRAKLTLTNAPVSFVLQSYHLPITFAVQPDLEYGRSALPLVDVRQVALVSALLNLNMGFGM